MNKIKEMTKKVIGMLLMYSIIGYFMHGVFAVLKVANDFLLDKNQ